MRPFNQVGRVVLVVAVVLAALLATSATALAAQPTVDLGTTSSFAILAGETITNTGSSTINGDVGLSPGTAFPGQSSATINGAVHLADAVALQAKVDLVTAYNDAAGRTPVTQIPTELGGSTLTPGVYDSASGTFEITGTLTLDALGDPNSVFIFQMESTLITAASSNVSLLNGARFCRIFWQVGSSATLGAGSHFVGHIFALTSITANTSATVQGQLLARNGAVTLHSNTITNGFCATVATTTTLAPTTTTTTEAPTTTTLGATTTTTLNSASTTTTLDSATTTTLDSATTTTLGSGTTTTLGSTTTTLGASTTTTLRPTTTTVGSATTTTGRPEFPNTGTSYWYLILFAGAFLALAGGLGFWKITRANDR